MAGFEDLDKTLFPLKDVSSVIEVFKGQLEGGGEPDLALLSIIAGAFENSLTCRSVSGSSSVAAATSQHSDPMEQAQSQPPVLELHNIQTLYDKFHAIMKTAVEVSNNNGTKHYATRELVKKVSDVVWNSLTRSYYKDRAHLQSLYSYLTGRKLDCFGVAFAVVAGCQALGYNDVHLALSEDHAWVVFGETGLETAEVTWHGKGNEDKRGQEVGKGVDVRSWLYVNNRPVICTRAMEVAALVSAINPSLNATHDAFEVAVLQQELLWLLYDLGHLTKYPMAIGNLGDLEEISATPGRVPCNTLFQEAIVSARTFYNNQHVYPYTYQGGYFYRNKKYKEAFESWANASDVIRLYNYSRDDEEIYKEFLEIANELIPHIMKVESSGFSANTILKKPECFANLLRFYDGICQWEEGSATPVLHIGWAKPLVNTISKFDASVRAQVHIVCESPETTEYQHHHPHHHHSKQEPRAQTSSNGSGAGGNCLNNNNYSAPPCKENGNGTAGSVDASSSEESGSLHPSIEALTAGCSEKILNPEYLLQGGGNPFVGTEDCAMKSNGSSASTSKQLESDGDSKKETLKEDEKIEDDVDDILPNRTANPTIVLHSQKMKELKDLLLAEKLNTHAISLHLTAQSQVQVSKKSRGCSNVESDGGGGMNMRPKRARRE
ncbi:PREDICTED: menin [Nicrophorus vespilloides]|uniref:Menin n=1 Tax=Nicrophorus vespilloides TaxID=110193 RepID=A0ABM1NCY3_NICVS|nr:PREDICTED: menin [Nicrophorus vespilloides]